MRSYIHVVFVEISAYCMLLSLCRRSDRYVARTEHNAERKEFLAENKMPVDELSNINVFK